MLIIAIFGLLSLLVLCLVLIHLRLDPAESKRTIEDIRENQGILATLAGLLFLPALLLILPEWNGRLWLTGAGLLGWGMLAALCWSHWVVPAAALVVPKAPHRPDLGPIPAMPPFPWRPWLRPAAGDDSGESETAGDGDVERSFRWTFVPRSGVPVEMAMTIRLSSERYAAARAEERRAEKDWAHYAERDMPELHTLTANFSRLHQDREWSTLEQASNVLNFTQQCIDYKSDSDTTPAAEWPRYPLETMMDEVGDCEDDVILAAAVLKRLGYDVVLLYYSDHCALGVSGARGLPGEFVSHGRKSYFYGETTAEGWRLGEVPEEYRGRRPEAVEEVKRIVSDE